jgi:hypothetical protein
MKDKDPITYQLNHLGNFLFELNLSQVNRKCIVENQDLKYRYPSLLHMHNLYRNDICMKYVQLTELNDNFHIIKPINKIIQEFEQNKAEKSDQLIALREIKDSLVLICDSEFSKNLKSKVRDLYLAHNDLMKREHLTVDMDKLNENFIEIVDLYNKVCVIWGNPVIQLGFTQRDTLENMLKDLKKV